MLIAINQIHSLGFSHRDLKPENVMLSSGSYNLKIIDFGFGKLLSGADHSGLQLSHVGTPGYMAPEVAEHTGAYLGQAVDLFAVGVIIFILLAGKHPFKEATMSDKVYKLLAGHDAAGFWEEKQRVMGNNFRFSPEFKNLCTMMWQRDPSLRLGLADIVQHPWMQGVHATPEAIQREFMSREQLNKEKQLDE